MMDATIRDSIDPWPAVRARITRVMSQEWPAVAESVVSEVRQRVPAYARPENEEYERAVRVGVGAAVSAFVAEFGDPDATRRRRDEVMRKLGEGEWREGRTLADLRAAFRVGGRAAWRYLVSAGARYEVPQDVLVWLADLLFDYLDSLAASAQEGYLRARRDSDGGQGGSARRLLRLLVDREGSALGMAHDLAGLVGWKLPREVSVVVVDGRPSRLDALSGTEVLIDVEPDGTRLLVPGQVDNRREQELAGALPGLRMAIGPTVALDAAERSSYWADRALEMARSGMLGSGRIVRCDEHLLELLLLADQGLLDLLTEQQLAAFAGMANVKRKPLLDTLTVALQCRGSDVDIAARLGVHPQTVRYRMRKLQSAFGDRLTNPESRFAFELVTRASGIRERGGLLSYGYQNSG